MGLGAADGARAVAHVGETNGREQAGVSVMNVADFLHENSIDVPNNIGDHTATCPQCSHKRKKPKLKCLSVKIDDKGACWHCHHCGWSGGISDGNKFDAIYDYVDGANKLHWQKLRYAGAKRFTQRKPNGGSWKWKDVRKGEPS